MVKVLSTALEDSSTLLLAGRSLRSWRGTVPEVNKGVSDILMPMAIEGSVPGFLRVS
jgi:hypothetical protein